MTKEAVACGQLKTAIRLWFEEGDPVSIHTLASAAHEVVHALFRQKGLSGLMYDSPLIRDNEERQRWSAHIKKPFNFFKHGRYDTVGAVEVFNTDLSTLLMMACCKGLTKIGAPIGGEELALTYWTFFQSPGAFPGHQHLLQNPQIQALQKCTSEGRKVYFLAFMTGYDAGTLSFRDARLGYA